MTGFIEKGRSGEVKGTRDKRQETRDKRVK